MTKKHKAPRISRYKLTRFAARHQHGILFILIWLIVFTVPYLGMSIVIVSDNPVGWKIVFRAWTSLLPYFFVSFANEFILFPLFFRRRHFARYLLGLFVVIAAFTVYQNRSYKIRHERFMQESIASGMSTNVLNSYFTETAHINIPILSRISIALLIVGGGLGYNLFASYRRRMFRTQRLERERLRQELISLRAQLSPHFFMNILNNIHSVMDTDVEKAQNMIIRLSKMLHYVTYETSLESVPLSREAGFILSYIELMKTRFPEERVSVSTSFPDTTKMGIPTVSPMIFIAFVENAFKHGITYRQHTDINISLTLLPGRRILFECQNTLPSVRCNPSKEHNGVGLLNVRRRLDVIYGDDYSLEFGPDSTQQIYKVALEIPYYETEMPRGR